MAPLDNVVNISQYTLLPGEISLLNKGLSFVPTRNYDPFETQVDLFKFFRKIRIKNFFLNQTAVDTDQSIIKNKSRWIPPPVTDPLIESFEKMVLKEVQSIRHSTKVPYHNLTITEKQAIKSLQTNNSIIIKPADKGGAVVVMDKTSYIT